MGDNLPPPSNQSSVQQMWLSYLTSPAVVTQDLSRPTYVTFGINYNNIPTPHPSHIDYSRVEMMKRKRAEEEKERKQNARDVRNVLYTGHRDPWVRHEEYLPFRRGIPNMRNFNHIPKIRLPRKGGFQW